MKICHSLCFFLDSTCFDCFYDVVDLAKSSISYRTSLKNQASCIQRLFEVILPAYADSLPLYANSLGLYANSLRLYANSLSLYADSLGPYANSLMRFRLDLTANGRCVSCQSELCDA